MSRSSIDSITPFQLFSLTIFSMLFGMTLLPSTIGHHINTAWFLGQMIDFAVVAAVVLMMLYFLKKIPGGDFADKIRNALGKFAGSILLLLFCVYFIFQAARLLSLETDNLMLFLFDKTPDAAVGTVFVVTVFLIGISGLRQIARLAEILLPLLLVPEIILIILLLSKCDMGELRTLYQFDSSDLPMQIFYGFNSFTCIETALFSACHVDTLRTRKKALLCGFGVNALLTLILFIAFTGTFTVAAGSRLIFPFTEMSRSIELGANNIFERIDVMFIGFRIIICLVFASFACHCSGRCLSGITGNDKLPTFPIAASALLILVLLGVNKDILSFYSRVVFYGQFAVLIFIIPIIFITALIRKRSDKA